VNAPNAVEIDINEIPVKLAVKKTGA